MHEVEAVVDQVEQAGTVERAADALRLDIELPGALRWTRRRVKSIHASLTTLKGLAPEPFGAAVVNDCCSRTVTRLSVVQTRSVPGDRSRKARRQQGQGSPNYLQGRGSARNQPQPPSH